MSPKEGGGGGEGCQDEGRGQGCGISWGDWPGLPGCQDLQVPPPAWLWSSKVNCVGHWVSPNLLSQAAP